MDTAKKTLRLAGLITLLSIWIPVENISAQGFIIPGHVPSHHPIIPRLTEHRVNVEIDDQIARVEVCQIFFNPSNRTVEGTYVFPLPKDASVSDFKMIADGKVMRGELLDRDKARKIYEDIVRRQIDPALLEYVDHNLFSAKIFPIPPGGEREIVLEYASLLRQEGELIRFSYPLLGNLSAERQWTRPEEPRRHSGGKNENAGSTGQIISIDLESRIPLKSIYSPTHEIDIVKKDDHHASVSYEGSRKENSDSFVLYYSFSKRDFGLNLLTYRPEKDENGFFMLLVSPKVAFSDRELLDKDILFVLDTSGSMEGEKIEQAKDALKYCIDRLRRGDRFNIITFSTETRMFNPDFVDADDYRADARLYVDRIEAKGGTNIYEALTDALKIKSEEGRPASIVFLTDGLPTVGETDPGRIVNHVSERNTGRVRIFTFGVGYDVNTMLLDKIAQMSRSVSDYIEPDEHIEQKISAFYDKIRYPVLTDLSLDYQGQRVEDVYPRHLPDLFKGSQLTVFGRYDRQRKARIVLKGKIRGREETFSYEADFSDEAGDLDFIPQLWATRKIGYLMDEIRLHGENDELREEIIRLSKVYGVMSPYTSYLVQEEEMLAGRRVVGGTLPRPMQDAFRVEGAASGAARISAHPESAPMDKGAFAVQMSKQSREMKEADAIGTHDLVKRVGNRTFYYIDDIWVDGEYDEDETIDIRYGSQAYIDLLLAHPELAKFAALGEKVIFQYKGKYIRISEEGKDQFTVDEIARLFR